MCATFNFERLKKPAFCERHAGDGMVKISTNRCSHDFCATVPSFNIKGSKTPAFCKAHAKDGMENVIRKRCLRADGVEMTELDRNDGETATKRGRQEIAADDISVLP